MYSLNQLINHNAILIAHFEGSKTSGKCEGSSRCYENTSFHSTPCSIQICRLSFHTYKAIMSYTPLWLCSTVQIMYCNYRSGIFMMLSLFPWNQLLHYSMSCFHTFYDNNNISNFSLFVCFSTVWTLAVIMTTRLVPKVTIIYRYIFFCDFGHFAGIKFWYFHLWVRWPIIHL